MAALLEGFLADTEELLAAVVWSRDGEQVTGRYGFASRVSIVAGDEGAMARGMVVHPFMGRVRDHGHVVLVAGSGDERHRVEAILVGGGLVIPKSPIGELNMDAADADVAAAMLPE